MSLVDLLLRIRWHRDIKSHVVSTASSPRLKSFAMAPTAIDAEVPIHTSTKNPSFPEPLKLSSSLDKYESFDVTTTIGREFPKANLVDWLNAPNADELIRDLAHQ
ncbi:hypothetical protein C8034_v000586 [Colletotrichum sidae]|uniref:Uncharacterized protein n=1 Tax=Colletotrichum sidae TaxID=1347389 RepID=A0A4R8TGD4_9PEZI|nr:hypothetical protein C8034_v000586 [Colletotrichum sidae]